MNMVPALSVACLLAAAGVAVWGVDAKQRRRYAIAAHLQMLLEMRANVGNDANNVTAAIEAASVGLKWGPPWMRHPATWKRLSLVLIVATVVALPWIALGKVLIGLMAWLGILAAGVFWAWRHWNKLRQQVLQQLPSFIDAMVRMVVLGHATTAAFLMAASTTKAPLAETLAQAEAFAKAGMPVDQALATASRHWDSTDFALLSAALQVGGRFGGRVDALLERIAGFMRDHEAATQELHALSTEVRLSAWLLGLLPIAVGGMIIATNANYFLSTWSDPSGRKMFMLAAGLQAVGGFLLYRIARLK